MISYIRQDLLKVSPNMGIIAHAINQTGSIGGLNKAICSKFQTNLEAIEVAKSASLGDVVYTTDEHAHIANLVVQAYPGYAAADVDSYPNRRNALKKALQSVAKRNCDIYLPYRMCCGLAGDRWSDIYGILKEFSDGYSCNVYICVPKWAEDRLEQRGILQPLTQQ